MHPCRGPEEIPRVMELHAQRLGNIFYYHYYHYHYYHCYYCYFTISSFIVLIMLFHYCIVLVSHIAYVILSFWVCPNNNNNNTHTSYNFKFNSYTFNNSYNTYNTYNCYNSYNLMSIPSTPLILIISFLRPAPWRSPIIPIISLNSYNFLY